MATTALDRIPTRHGQASLAGISSMPDRMKDGSGSFDGKRDFCNAAGYVQGGILSAMLDGAMGAVVFVMTDGRLYNPTISLTVNFLAPAKPGPIIAEARVTQLGKRIAFVEGRLTADDGSSRPQRPSGKPLHFAFLRFKAP